MVTPIAIHIKKYVFLLGLCWSTLLMAQQKDPASLLAELDSLKAERNYTLLAKKADLLLQSAQKNENAQTLFLAYKNILLAHYIYGVPSERVDQVYENALADAERYQNDTLTAYFQYYKAVDFTRKNEYNKAYQLFQKNEALVRSSTLQIKPHYYTDFGYLYYRLNEYDLAFDKLKEAAAIYKQRNDLLNTAVIYNNLGILYKNIKKADSALFYQQKALRISKQEHDTIGMVKSYNNMGLTHQVLTKNYTKAEDYYQKALAADPTNPTNSLLINYANLLSLNEEYTKAENLLLSIYEQPNDLTKRADVIELLIKIYNAQGKYQQANQQYKQLFFIQEEIYSKKRINEIEKLKAAFEFDRKEAQIAHLQAESNLQKVESERKITLTIGIFSTIVLIFTISLLLIKINQNKIEKDKLTLSQRLLRTQMNPHFIFNTLGAIQTFIFEQKNKEASSYLSKFAKLIRIILDNSQHNAVSFESELNALEHYLQLQSLRYGEELTYSIKLSADLEADQDFEIPPMLFQPFVENAVEHGLRNISNRKLNIDFQLKENLLCCTITDNGIGRKKAAEQRQKNKPSLSTEIIQKRLAIYNKHEASVRVEDLYENGQACGTRVYLQIPIMES